MKNKFGFLMGFIIFFAFVRAQEIPNEEEGNEKNTKLYEVIDIQISGENKYTSDQISTFSKINKGDFIQISGNTISVAIKKLWTTRLFSNVEVFVNKINENQVKLRYELTGFPTIGAIKIIGVSKSKAKDLLKEVDLKEGKTITPETEKQIQNFVTALYEKKGYPEPSVEIDQKPLPENASKKNITITIKKGERVKIKTIAISGNEHIKTKKILAKVFKKTRKKSLNPLKKSKLIEEEYKEELKKLESFYKSMGYRDIKINEQKINRLDKNNYEIQINVNEGKKYFLGNIDFVGNASYSTDILKKIFAYEKGDEYDDVGINKKISGSEKDDDIQTLYLDSGYLFANIQLDEVAVRNDSIDIKINIKEGEKARYNKEIGRAHV